MRLFKSDTIWKRLLYLYLPILIMPGLLILYIANQVLIHEMDQASKKQAVQTVDVINRHLEIYLDELERISLFPYFHQEVMAILKRDTDWRTDEEKFQEYKFFEGLFNNIMLHPREDLLNVSLYRSDGLHYFNTRVYVSLDITYDWEKSSWYDHTIAANGDIVYTIPNDLDKRFTSFDHDIFYISRLIKGENGEPLGVILLDANFQGIEDILEAIGLDTNANVVLRDDQGSIVFMQHTQNREEIKHALIKGESNLDLEGEKLFIASKKSDKTNWEIAVAIPSAEISNSFVFIRTFVYYMLGLFVFIVIVFTLSFSRSITNPISTLRKKVKMVEKGDYDVSLNNSEYKEINELDQAFYNMSYKIKELIQEVYVYDIKQKEAELNNLKMQIRPHFLYNTLEAIRSLADIQDNQEIAEMISSLGSMLRYSVKKHGKFVSIEEELDYTKQYLTIQKMMLHTSFTIGMHIDEEILEQNSAFYFSAYYRECFSTWTIRKKRKWTY